MHRISGEELFTIAILIKSARNAKDRNNNEAAKGIKEKYL
jgi:hypothetical protein